MKHVSWSIVAVMVIGCIGCGRKADNSVTTTGATTTATTTTTTTAGGGACNHADTFMCVQYGKLTASEAASEKQDCEKEKGKWLASCPTAGLLGTCTNNKHGGDVQMKLYKGAFTTAGEAKKEMCSDSGDVFTAAK